MKRKKIKRNFAEKAYQTTEVDKEITQGQITKMLEQLGIENIRVTQQGNDYRIEFLVRLRHDESPRKVRIDVPFTPELEDKTIDITRKKNILFRVLYWHLKDKFVAVYNGLKEFEEEFLADLVIVHNGKEQRLGDVIVPKYKQQLKKGKVAVLAKVIN